MTFDTINSLIRPALLLSVLLSSGGTTVLSYSFVYAQTEPVLGADFHTLAPSAFSGITDSVDSQGYAGLGTRAKNLSDPDRNVFGGSFLRNASGDNFGGGPPPSPTTLTLTDLPEHTTVSLGFLLAIIDSWDGNGCHSPTSPGDTFNVTVDRELIFSEIFNNSGCGDPGTYEPPEGVTIVEREQLGFNTSSERHVDSGYNMGLDPAFNNIPHTASTLTVDWFAGGGTWQGGLDESWAIDNVEVFLDAAVVGIIGTTGDVVATEAPASVRLGATESNTDIIVFTEMENVVLTSDIPVNISLPGIYTRTTDFTPDTIPTGTAVSSYFVHIDPVGGTEITLAGMVTFGGEIIGVIATDGGRDQSTEVLGSSSTEYPLGSSVLGSSVPELDGTTRGDSIGVSADRHTLTVKFVANVGIDQIRVITTVSLVPTPMTSAVDHFKCYKVQGDRFSDLFVDLEDEFGSMSEVEVLRPKRFCPPVDKNGEGIANPATGLICYRIRGEEENRELVMENQFGTQVLEIKEPKYLCVPSTEKLEDMPE